mgnify:CR=1 FL=1
MSSHEDLHRQLETVYVLLQDGTRRALAPVGLTPTQYSLLALVADAPREGLSITTLASRLLCTRGNASAPTSDGAWGASPVPDVSASTSPVRPSGWRTRPDSPPSPMTTSTASAPTSPASRTAFAPG